MNSIRRRILGFQLYSNAEILLESRRDGNLERAEEAKRKLVDEIVPAIRQGMDGADKKFSLVMEMVRLRADAKGFDRDSIRELEVLLR